eukprot:TRINITY_DN2662_c3_g1_i1.p1 TRINITY_DN2662_c3_g1~~TRINITY_DN2662_c3_g1_i1.p1  ORF type:complete len:305 (-),score=80.32 TRINITY_DN2662_c3_g1_i1:134-1048(-)
MNPPVVAQPNAIPPPKDKVGTMQQPERLPYKRGQYWTDSGDRLLLATVTEHEVWSAKHGTKKEAWNKIVATMKQSSEVDCSNITTRSAYDRFSILVNTFRGKESGVDRTKMQPKLRRRSLNVKQFENRTHELLSSVAGKVGPATKRRRRETGEPEPSQIQQMEGVVSPADMVTAAAAAAVQQAVDSTVEAPSSSNGAFASGSSSTTSSSSVTSPRKGKRRRTDSLEEDEDDDEDYAVQDSADALRMLLNTYKTMVDTLQREKEQLQNQMRQDKEESEKRYVSSFSEILKNQGELFRQHLGDHRQ